jgi:hypothetical protein
MSEPEPGSSFATKFATPPVLGILAFLVILSWRPMAHTLTMLMHDNLHGYVRGFTSLAVGAAGVVLMWKGFKRDEVTASLMGIMAGSLIWTGWAEEGFNSFAYLLGVQPLLWNGNTLLTPGLLMIEASGIIMLMMLILIGSNKDTQCRMFLWFHRTFRIWPDKRTPGYKRQFSRIATMEYLFVVWFFYVFNIVIFDPRLLGPEHPVTAMLLLLIFIWGCWLLWKLSKIRQPGPAIRYAIPTVGCWWVLVETSVAMQLFPEVWLRPMEFPVTMTLLGIVCAAIWWLYASIGKQSVRPQPVTRQET